MENELLLYKQEVKELTELLRNEWEDLKFAIEQEGIDTSACILLGYFETEDEVETGLLWSNDGLKRFEFAEGALNVEDVSKEDVEEDFPQVIVIDDMQNFVSW